MGPYVQYITEGSGAKTQLVFTNIKGIYFEDGYIYVTYKDASGNPQRKVLPFKEGRRLAVFPDMREPLDVSPHVPESPKIVSELWHYPEDTVDIFDRQGRRIWGGYVDRCRFQGDQFVAEKYYKDANKFRTVVAIPREFFGHYHAVMV